MIAAGMVGLVIGGCAKSTLRDRANDFVRRNQYNEAQAALAEQVSKDPKDGDSWSLLLRVDGLTGDLARLDRDFNAWKLAGAGVPGEAEVALGHAFELAHQFEKALASYDLASELAPTSSLGPREGGLRAARWGEPEEAIPRLREAIHRGDNDAEIYHALGLAQMQAGDWEKAEAAYREGIRHHPEAAENYLGLATLGLKSKNYALALEAYTSLLKLKPTFTPAMLGRAYALLELDRFDDARKALEEASIAGASPRAIELQKKEIHRREQATP